MIVKLIKMWHKCLILSLDSLIIIMNLNDYVLETFYLDYRPTIFQKRHHILFYLVIAWSLNKINSCFHYLSNSIIFFRICLCNYMSLENTDVDFNFKSWVMWYFLCVFLLCPTVVLTGTKLEPECSRLQLQFATASSDFTTCLGKNTKPVRICVTCFQDVSILFI